MTNTSALSEKKPPLVAYSIWSHWHQHFLSFDLWPFVHSEGVGGSEREKRDWRLWGDLLSQQPRASGSRWAGWASAHPIFWDQKRTGTATYIYCLPTQILVACTGPATNMMYLAWNGVAAEHICSMPLTEMYFLCCTQQLASTNYNAPPPKRCIMRK